MVKGQSQEVKISSGLERNRSINAEVETMNEILHSSKEENEKRWKELKLSGFDRFGSYGERIPLF